MSRIDASAGRIEGPVELAREEGEALSVRGFAASAGQRSLRRRALTISAIYAAGAGAWIALSDPLLAALVRDSEARVEVGVLKGFFFVAVTAVLLYVLVSRAFRSLARAAEAAKQEERLAGGLIESMPGIVYFYDSRGRFLRWNRNFERVSGYSHEEIARMHPLDFFAGTERVLVEERIAEVFSRGESNVEASFVSKDGRPKPYVFTGKRVVFEGEGCLVGIGVDVSQQKYAETELRKSEERYRTTLESMMEGCQLLDFDWRYLYLNAAAAAQNRRPNSELLGRRMPDAWPGIEETHVFTMLRRCMDERCPVQGETEFTFSDGAKAWFDIHVQPIPEGIFVLSVDITERKRAEMALHEANDRLEIKIAERTRDLDAAKERAEAADRLKSAFLATMSHELRTPLNSILGFTGIVLQELPGPLLPEQKKQLGMVQASARHLLDLINDVLDISKIEAGQLVVRSAPFDIRASVQRVAASVMPSLEKKGLTLRVLEPDSPAIVRSDQRRVEQILLNLLNNAIKFTDRGEVTLKAELEEAQGLLRLSVADTGVGMHEAELSQLFQPFHQLHSGLGRPHEGTGLGLAICRRLAELLGGSIGVTSTWGRGSEFSVVLPSNGALRS